jgi:hypothetical protein
MTETTNNDAQARDFLENGLSQLREALNSKEPALPAALGVEAIVRAALARPLVAPAPERTGEAAEILSALAQHLCETITETVSSEPIYFALGAVSGLFAAPDDFYSDRLLHGALLATELKTVALRADLKKRNYPLMRAVALRGAWESPMHHSSALN